MKPEAQEFRDDDAGYLAWLADNPEGFVINIARSYSSSQARLHRANCWTIRGDRRAAGAWTGPYVKVCSAALAEVQIWGTDQVGKRIPLCGICKPASDVIEPATTDLAEQAHKPPPPKGRSEIHGPTTVGECVEAWADDYIRFERRPVWQERLRTEIRARCRQLNPSHEQILHATFFGAKRHNADVENLMLYNVDTFRFAGRNGIRFEHGAAVPLAPDGAEYAFCYRYALAPRTGHFTFWKQRRKLASFDWTDLGAFNGDKKLAQVWLALARGGVDVKDSPVAAEPRFAVRVQVRPPQGLQPVWGVLVKGIFDGVIGALQAHTDTAILPDVVARLANDLREHPADIEQYLLDQRHAVLGAVHRLVYPCRKGVKWDPSDHLCGAGELLAARAVDERWSIRGELVELYR